MKLLGHPAHPASVHLPLGLLLSVPLWDAAAAGGGGPWSGISFWCLAAGLLAALPAVATGVLDFLGVDGDHAGMPDLWRHMALMGTALSLDAASLLARGGTAPMPAARFAVAAGLAVLAALVLGVGGWYGGHLVYRHKIGVEEK